MISRRILAAFALLCAISVPAYAQKTNAQINTEINAQFQDNTIGQITPQNLRNITGDIVNSIMPTAPVTANNPPCFNGTTGLLKDCGIGPLGTMSTQNSNSVAIIGGSITGLPSPTVSADAATKGYVDSTSSGLNILAPSALATAAVLPNTPTYSNGTAGVGATLTAGSNSTLTVDGTVAVLNTVVLVKNQVAPAQNGIYTVTTAGSVSVPWVLTRATYFDQPAEMKAGSYTFVVGGSTNANSAFTLQSSISVVGTDPVNWTLFSQSGTNINSLTGTISLLPGTGTSVATVGQNITIGNTLQAVSIMDAAYGAKCNGIFFGGANFGGASNLTISSGSPNLLSTGSTFTSADVGKSIWVPGAGAAGAGLSTTILTFTDATHVVLNANASTTVTAFAVTPTSPLVYGTDDTTAIQAAMNATPIGGILDIPGQQTGCLIKKQGANNYALLQDHPFSIRGHGHFSNLMTDPSIPSTVDDLLVQVGSYDWANIVWENFSIGDTTSFLPPTLQMYTRHGKRGLALVDSPSAGFIGTIIRNISIGESGNDYSMYLGNPSGGGSQLNIITQSKIWGGVHLDKVADSHRITYNALQGSSTFGGLFEFVSGAGKFEFSSNNVTWAGGFEMQGGNKPAVINNYFEELFATSEANNAMVDFNGGSQTIAMPTFTGNIVSVIISSTVTPVRYNNVSNPNFGDNFIAVGVAPARTGVTSVGTLSCIAPNFWSGVTSHFSTAIANTYGGC